MLQVLRITCIISVIPHHSPKRHILVNPILHMGKLSSGKAEKLTQIWMIFIPNSVFSTTVIVLPVEDLWVPHLTTN